MTISENIVSFVSELNSTLRDQTIPPRIDKAIKMYKKETNLLYIEKENEFLTAVIKSQTHPKELEYAVKLNKDGSFFCGTQNLHPCGGLRGKICKHIILALFAAIKSKQGTKEELIKWVQNTNFQKPSLDKTEATRIFLKYQNALEGKIEC